MTRRRNPSTADRLASADVGTVELEGGRVARVPLALARHFIKICTAASAELVAEKGLKSGQFAVLAHLSGGTGEPGIDQNSIAARMGVDRARVSQLVDELEAMGLIDRRVSDVDRRARVLRLTPRGEELWARLQPAVREAQMRVLASLAPDERELFLNLLVRIIQSNRALARTGTLQSRSYNKNRSSRSGKA